MKDFTKSAAASVVTVAAVYFFVPRSLTTVLLDLMVFGIVWYMCWIDLVKNEKMLSIHRNYELALFAILMLGGGFTAFVVDVWGPSFSTIYLFSALAVLMLGERPGRGVGVALSSLMFTHFGRDLWMLIDGIFVTLISSMSLRRVFRRSDVVKSALVVSATMLGLSLAKLGIEGYLGGYEIYVSVLNPFVSSIFILGILPYLEYASRIYSNIGLMELGNLNHPLLKELSIKAPGTYQHSTLVANLAEAAAERIGANSLLARVASYYHDIGKIKRSEFFVENQTNGQNPHDEISPHLSHLILNEHVKFGQYLARKHRLPIPIECIITEHHGTRVQKYFYYKAKEQGQNVNEDDFRYPGPKPRFKESGIIMLADSVEAASRTLKGKTHSQIKSLVEEIVMGILAERQLDESELTLEELEMIIDEFTRVLVTFYHRRIEYPEEGKL